MRRFLWGAAFALACSSGGSNFDGGTNDAGGDVAASFTLRVDPVADNETVTIGLQSQSVQFHAYREDAANAQEVDVTSQVTWTIGDVSIATSTGGGAYSLQGVGGV